MNTTTATPTPEALAIAVIFKDFAIDHTPDGWPAVKQMHLNAAAAELERQHAEIEALRANLSKKPIIGSGRTQYDRLIKAARNIEQSVNSSSSWGRVGPDDSDIAWQEFKALASDVCTLIDSPPDNGALTAQLNAKLISLQISVDVSTGDHDAGHRLFGTVTGTLDTDPLTLLCDDAKPNFSAPQPLSVARIKELSVGMAFESVAFARAIEAAHGIGEKA